MIEDNKSVCEMMSMFFEKENWDATYAYDGEEAIEKFKAAPNSWDMITLDLNLPKMDGMQVNAEIRKISKTVPIIILTARDSESDQVLGLEMGADDYVVKPFELTVLYSRILALLRRTKAVRETKLFCNDLVIDKEKLAVYYQQEEITVSQPEYHLLLLLMENKWKTVT